MLAMPSASSVRSSPLWLTPSALAELDANGDGVVDAKDASFGDLRVWVDANADGVSQSGELRTLDALGIASMDVGATRTSELDNGNWIGLQSRYTSVDGGVHQVADVWFRAERAGPAGAGVGTGVGMQVSAMAQALGGYALAQATADAAGGRLTVPALAGVAAGVAPPSSALDSSVAALGDQMRQYHASTGLSGGVGAHTDEWFRKASPVGMLAAK